MNNLLEKHEPIFRHFQLYFKPNGCSCVTQTVVLFGCLLAVVVTQISSESHS